MNVQDTIRQLLMLSEMEKEVGRRDGKYYKWLEGKLIPSTVEEADKDELARLYQMDIDARQTILENHNDLLLLGLAIQEIAELLIQHIDWHAEMLEICEENIELVSNEYKTRGSDENDF